MDVAILRAGKCKQQAKLPVKMGQTWPQLKVERVRKDTVQGLKLSFIEGKTNKNKKQAPNHNNNRNKKQTLG